MGLLLDIALKNAQEHPQADLTHCVNYRQRRLECRRCVKICPRQVYDEHLAVQPKWDQCQGCGLCVTACAARCIAPPPLQVKRHLLLADQGGDVIVSCERSESRVGHVEACIAQMPWELLACLALGGSLTLNMKACAQCPHEDCRTLISQQLTRLRDFLGEERWARRVRICRQDEQTKQEKPVSRRALFSDAARKGKKAGTLALTDVMNAGADGLVYRRLLAQRVRMLEEDEGVWRMELPWFSDACYGCGICEKLCPNGAIAMTPEGEGMRSITIVPYKCTGCGVCAEVCREGGVEEICRVRVSSLEGVRMKRVQTAACARCARAIRPGEEYCAVCRQKKK